MVQNAFDITFGIFFAGLLLNLAGYAIHLIEKQAL